MTLAFSYIRFSSAKQGAGDSLSRQTRLAKEYADKNGLLLDNSSYRDLGVSAFKGKNAEEGMLATFLEAVDKGIIPKGSVLLVESLDRISRAEITEALPLFMSIINRGITIVTLADSPPQKYTKERINADHGMTLFGSMMVLLRAHEESALKSQRVKAKYDEKRRQGKVITSKGPSWLVLDKPSMTWTVLHNKAAVINRIYDMAGDGLGQNTITRTLNAEGVPVMSTAKRWTQGVIGAILRNPSVYGYFTQKSGGTQEVENYYPSIMEKEKFMRVQDSIKGRRAKGGIRKNVPNLFSGLCFCSDCGTRARYVKTRNGYGYLQCSAAFSGDPACASAPLPYEPCETAFLYCLTYKTEGDSFNEFLERQAAIAPALQGEIDVLKGKQSKLVQLALLAPDVSALAAQLNGIQTQISELEKQLKQRDKQPLSSADLKESSNLFTQHMALASGGHSEELIEMRRRIKVTINRLTKRVEVGFDRHGKPWLWFITADDARGAECVERYLSKGSVAKRKYTKK